MQRERPASLDFRLYAYWTNLPPGTGVTMADMMAAMDIDDSQAVRNSLSRLRNGRAADPSQRGARLRELPVIWSPQDRRYYHLAWITPEVIETQAVGAALGRAFRVLQTRARSLDSALGSEGLVAAFQLLDEQESRELLAQIPLELAQDVANRFQLIAQARQLMALSQALGGRPLPPAP